ncbi:MAG: hypothetical protein FWC67_04465 [Defluviitaleaceae bacterium]|nr:hypothetical protein [Defluviitaleaceae bacterium]
MKKIITAAILLCFMALLAGCVYDENHITYSRTNAENQPFESSIPLDLAASLFAQAQEAWDNDDGYLWGFNMFAPSMIADPITRHVAANMPDDYGHFTRYGDVYVGILPDDVFVSHTTANFAGLTWGMLMWSPDIAHVFETEQFELFGGYEVIKTGLLQVLIHEGFHALQFDKVVSGEPNPLSSQVMPHLNECAESRISVLLEINALWAALRSEGDEQLQAIHDAMSIRAHRREGRPVVYLSENLQEIVEGLAVFSEYVLFRDVEALFAQYHYRYWVDSLKESSGMGFTFPYFTGAVYAWFLRQAGTDWQQGITFETDLAALLQEALGFEALTPFYDIDLERYGYSHIAPGQREWVENFQRIQQGAEEFLTQRNISIEGLWTFGGIFDVYLVNVPDEATGWAHTVNYGHMDFVTANWRLEVFSGFMHTAHFPTMAIVVPFFDNIEISQGGRRAIAPAWTLDITDDNYKIIKTDNGEIEIVRR